MPAEVTSVAPNAGHGEYGIAKCGVNTFYGRTSFAITTVTTIEYLDTTERVNVYTTNVTSTTYTSSTTHTNITSPGINTSYKTPANNTVTTTTANTHTPYGCHPCAKNYFSRVGSLDKCIPCPAHTGRNVTAEFCIALRPNPTCATDGSEKSVPQILEPGGEWDDYADYSGITTALVDLHSGASAGWTCAELSWNTCNFAGNLLVPTIHAFLARLCPGWCSAADALAGPGGYDTPGTDVDGRVQPQPAERRTVGRVETRDCVLSVCEVCMHRCSTRHRLQAFTRFTWASPTFNFQP
jgi:hypothetical protein